MELGVVERDGGDQQTTPVKGGREKADGVGV